MKIKPRYSLLLVFLLTTLFATLAAWWGIELKMKHDARLSQLYGDLGKAFGGIRHGANRDKQIESLKQKISDEQGRDIGAEIDQMTERVKEEPYAKSQLLKKSEN